MPVSFKISIIKPVSGLRDNCLVKLTTCCFAVATILCQFVCTQVSPLCAEEPILTLGEFMRTKSAVSETEANGLAMRFAQVPNEGGSVLQDQQTDHLPNSTKLNQQEITNRFHAGINVPPKSAQSTADARTGLTWNECEESMSQITALHKAGNWTDGLRKSDDFLRALDCTPNAYAEYRILTAALAFQMAAMAGNAEKAEHFGKLAMQLSRQFENYKLEEIEGSYYQVAGYQFDFPELLAATKSLRNDFAGLAPEEAVKRSEALVAACGSLPETSIFRLKADLFEALAKQEWENDLFNDLRRFGSIQSRAESVGNQVIKNACEPIVTELFQQIQGVAHEISAEIQGK